MGHRRKTIIATGALVALSAAGLTASASVGARPGEAVATLRDAAGNTVGRVRLVPRPDGTVNVRTVVTGAEATNVGFHGFHVHSVGSCDPASTDPAGNTVPFLSAGGHYAKNATSHGFHEGDLPVLLVMKDGSARQRSVTDAFTIGELIAGDGSAMILHGGRDNYANIPGTTPTGAERYHSHVSDLLGPDTLTRATGDAGARFACGVVVPVP